MNPYMRSISIIIGIGIGFLSIQGTTSQNNLDGEKQIWQQEKRYYDCWIKGDIEEYLSLLHESFFHDSFFWDGLLLLKCRQERTQLASFSKII